MRLFLRAVCCLTLGILAGCSDESAPEGAEIIRPVLSVVAEPETAGTVMFAGTIESRYSADLSFRLLGRVATRPVNVGDIVRKDAVIATLDQTALLLAVQSSKADYSNAQAQVASASANEERLRKLLASDSISKANYEAAQQADLSAKANASRAKAELDKAQEQLSYANLSSDFDGVVTATGADVGQTVSPGQTVVSVARPDAREAVLDIPDSLIDQFKTGDRFEISLQSLPYIKTDAALREIAPQSDSVTRTRRVRFSLDQAPVAFRLGSTITALQKRTAQSAIELPLSALLEKDGAEQVWTVDLSSLTVGLKTIAVAHKGPDSFVVAAGLDRGTRVVVAGIHSLQPGQKVKLDDGAAP